MQHIRRQALGALLASSLLATATLAEAQVYPDRPVKVILGFAPGGTNDILARVIAAKLQERLKQPFVVDNRPGAASMIAAELAGKAPADGYTLFVASSNALTINPAICDRNERQAAAHGRSDQPAAPVARARPQVRMAVDVTPLARTKITSRTASRCRRMP